MTQGLGAGIVRIRSHLNGELAGHGVLVDDEHVATCAHVINAALGRDLSSSHSAVGEVVRLEFPLIAEFTAAPPERYARVDSWAPPGTAFEGVDVAGLTLVSEARPTGAAPMPLANEHRTAGDVLLYGAVAGRPGGWVTARLRPLVTQHRQQIDQLAHDAFTARPGFSGTPVVDAATGDVLGLLVATAVGQESSDIYAIPLPSVVSSWPEVFAPLPPSPYKGLSAFESADRDLFFGRASVVQELVSAVATHGLVPVVGASGIGKSSVVYAGLLPHLAEQRAGWGFVTVRPRPTLLSALAAGFARLLGSGVPVPAGDLEAWQDRLFRLGLAGAAELACAATSSERLLVTVDQFEEVLAQDCSLLLQQFAELPDEGTLTAVLTLREDSFGTFFVRHARFGEQLRQNAVALRGMDRGELDEVVRGPAALRGVRISDRLVGELVGRVSDRPGALPLLEFSLDQMWRTLRPGQVLSFDAYEEIGRLDGALAAHADRVLDGLNETEQAVVRKLFVNHLTFPARSDIRQVLRRSECAPGDWQIIVRLANERLLTIGRDDGGNETAEVVHEALLQAWGQLRSWLDAERPFRSWRQHLRYAMTQWNEAEESDGALQTGALLATSEGWLAERTADLDLDERRFIEMSLTRREKEDRDRVLYGRSLARALSRAAETTEDPILALLLAIEVLERSPDAQADRLVRMCLRRLGASEIVPLPTETDGVAFDRARQRLTLCDWCHGPGASKHWLLSDSTASLIVDERGQALYGADTVIPMPGPVVVAAYIRAGIACLGTEAGELAVWHLADRAEKVGSRDLGVPITSVAVSDTGQTLAVACDDSVIRALRGEDLSDLEDLSSPGFIRDVDVGADQLVAALSHDRRVRTWDLASHAFISESAAGPSACRLAVDSGGDYVVVGDAVPSGRIPLSVPALTALARRAAGRDLTADERRRYTGDAPT